MQRSKDNGRRKTGNGEKEDNKKKREEKEREHEKLKKVKNDNTNGKQKTKRKRKWKMEQHFKNDFFVFESWKKREREHGKNRAELLLDFEIFFRGESIFCNPRGQYPDRAKKQKEKSNEHMFK